MDDEQRLIMELDQAGSRALREDVSPRAVAKKAHEVQSWAYDKFIDSFVEEVKDELLRPNEGAVMDSEFERWVSQTCGGTEWSFKSPFPGIVLSASKEGYEGESGRQDETCLKVAVAIENDVMARIREPQSGITRRGNRWILEEDEDATGV